MRLEGKVAIIHAIEGRAKKLSALGIAAIAGIGLFSGVYLWAPQVPADIGCQITEKLLDKQERMAGNYRLSHTSLCGLHQEGTHAIPNVTFYNGQSYIIDTRATGQTVIRAWMQGKTGWEESLAGLDIGSWQKAP